jgi:DnaJ-class molecular chaperone
VTQLGLLDETWECDACNGTGRATDRETGTTRRCLICEGVGRLDYDPAIAADNPFAGLGDAA